MDINSDIRDIKVSVKGKKMFAFYEGKWRFCIYNKDWNSLSICRSKDAWGGDWVTYQIKELKNAVYRFVDTKKRKGNIYLKKGIEREKYIYSKLLEYNKEYDLKHSIRYNNSGIGVWNETDVDIIIDEIVGLECCSFFDKNSNGVYFLSTSHKRSAGGGLLSWIEKQNKSYNFLFLCWRNVLNDKIEFLDLNDKFLNVQYFRWRNGKEFKGDLNYRKVKSRVFGMDEFFKKLPGGVQTTL